MPAEPHEAAALPHPDLVERLSKNSPLNALMDQKTFHAGARMGISTIPPSSRAKTREWTVEGHNLKRTALPKA